ncbi:hypothetical protein HW115_02830 [Verrucomicrobiaceae bacterium N1E253]|uniref:Histidine kinase domain-containing protein n=1 Tax=Oceaniferula marina TaxID=2748318 RepID=A0A851GBH9_9BACT|nr:ATP-binding protein [Oceaniferula marina]NWK54529.1 hypothetical protein [Oceaniferula marina]
MKHLPILPFTRLLLGLITITLISCSDDDGQGINPYTQKGILDERAGELERQLSSLPKRNAKWMAERFGYHSIFHNADSEAEPMNEWVQLKFNRPTPVKSIALIPAVDPQGDQLQSYGFPRRFRVEFRSKKDGEVVHIIDRTQSDFQNPGVAPVMFEDLDINARYMKIIVERGQVVNDMEFFALSEIVVMEQRGVGMVNVAPYSQRSTSAHFQSYPYWDIRFIADRLSPLGFPLGKENVRDTDFIVELPRARDGEGVEIIIDLGEKKPMGRLAFYPAEPPSDILLPHFGYPDSLTIEVFDDASMKVPLYHMFVLPDYKLRKHHPKRHFRPVTDLAFAVPMGGVSGRYVKVTASGLSDYHQDSILAFGEIIVWGGDENLSLNCGVTVHTPDGQLDSLETKRLVDGYVDSYPIIDTYLWLKGLAQREALERDLAVVHHQIIELDRTIELFWRYLLWGLMIIFFVMVVYLVIRNRRAKALALHRLREQISRDLHDDVGCNLGSISLGISNLQDEVQDESLAEEFEELELISRETSVALEEAVFFTRKNQIYLSDLVDRLEQRARIILEENVCIFSVEGKLVDRVVDFPFKRQVMLLYKEALYNCSRHAHATKVEVTVSSDYRFIIVFRDNGIGFDVNTLERVSGLDNMRTRAKKIGGELMIDSVPGEGTTLKLVVEY